MSSTTSTSFVSQILEPGGGVMLLPFVRVIIGTLFLLCMLGATFLDVARIHMIILSFLSLGLLLSLSFFESEYKKQQRARYNNNTNEMNFYHDDDNDLDNNKNNRSSTTKNDVVKSSTNKVVEKTD